MAAQKRDDLLGQGWQSSGDRLWTTSGDAEGLHVLVAEAKTGYAWHTVADLAVPGLETDQWIGHGCTTGSGQRAVIVYGPRGYTNNENEFSRGGLTAIVNLTTGAVTKLPIRTTLAYFNPGCGTGETAALTQGGGETIPKTGVVTVDTVTGKLSKRIELAGQVTSATPVDDGFVVADSLGLLKVTPDEKTKRVVLGTGGVPAYVHADADGGLVFVDRGDNTSRVRRMAPDSRDPKTSAPVLATGAVNALSVATGAAGRVFITGTATKVERLPRSVAKLDVPATTEVSSRGETAVTDLQLAKPAAGSVAASDPGGIQPVHIQAKSLRTGRQFGFTVDPGATLAPRWDDTVDANRVCAVPRNDPHYQAYQPTPREVEWEVDNLTRGTVVPAQIMLGVLGQESNLWQAARNLYPGEYGNPLIGNYYGLAIYDDTTANDWDINWSEADCGYGVSQTTDGMRLSGSAPTGTQAGIGTHYDVNIQSGLSILISKWNQLAARGMKVNNGDPKSIENWFYATWAYNSGFHDGTASGDNGVVGLGWLNNPANPIYPPRQAFGLSPTDFAHPERWSYPEKVLGFATYPPAGYSDPGTVVPFFRAATWLANEFRATAAPGAMTFCTADNDCFPGSNVQPTAPEVADQPAGPCQHTNAAGQFDLKCWVKTSASWKDCTRECGHEFIRYDPGVPKPAAGENGNDGTSFAPICNNSNVEDWSVVDDVTTATQPARLCTPGIHANMQDSNFDFTYGGDDGHGNQAAKIDLHQVGGGYGAHYWYSYTRSDTTEGRKTELTGTWTFPTIDGNAQLKVFIPAHLADAAVTYVVDTASGPRSIQVNQAANHNTWYTLGTFPFYGQPKIHLDTIVQGANGTLPVAFDAAAIKPIGEDPDGYTPMIVNEWSSGEAPYYCLVLKGNADVQGTPAEYRACDKNFGYGYWNAVAAPYVMPADPATGRPELSSYFLKDRTSGLCLEVAESSNVDGAKIQLGQCNNADTNQMWTAPPPPPTRPDSPPSQPMINLSSAKCMNVGDSAANGTSPVILGTCDTSNQPWQRWRSFMEYNGIN